MSEKQKYRHEGTGKVQELSPIVAAMFPRFKPIEAEDTSTSVNEQLVVQDSQPARAQASKGAKRARNQEEVAD